MLLLLLRVFVYSASTHTCWLHLLDCLHFHYHLRALIFSSSNMDGLSEDERLYKAQTACVLTWLEGQAKLHGYVYRRWQHGIRVNIHRALHLLKVKPRVIVPAAIRDNASRAIESRLSQIVSSSRTVEGKRKWLVSAINDATKDMIQKEIEQHKLDRESHQIFVNMLRDVMTCLDYVLLPLT